MANSDEKRKVWMRYEVAADGSVSNGRVFADVTAGKEDGMPDGMKVDSMGNIYGTAPGGIWVFSPEGKHLGTFKPPETPASCAWGDDGKSLYVTAHEFVPSQARRCRYESTVSMKKAHNAFAVRP